MTLIRRIALVNVAAALALLAGPGTAWADLRAYWNFNSGNTGTPNAEWPGPIAANQGTGTINMSGWTGQTGAFTGSTINAINPDGAGLSLCPLNQTGNGSYIQLEISMTNYESLILTYATQRTGTGYNSQQWSWSTNGTTFTDHGAAIVPPSSYALQTVDFSSVTALDGAANVYLRCTLTGATSATGNNRFDNIQLNATFAGPIATGACCTGVTCQVTTLDDCINNLSGDYLGDGTDCDPNMCAGACCDAGNCTITTSGNCAGEFLGNGTTCAGAPCALGACCHGGTCTQETKTACEAFFPPGLFRGAGAPCDGSACPPDILNNLIINEVDSDTPGTDVAEFVELHNRGGTTIDLTGTCLVFYNGASNLSYYSVNLTGTIPPGGYYLVGNAGVVPTPTIIFANNFLQNGQDAVALYFGSAASFPNNTPPTNTNLIDAVVYGTTDPDATVLMNILLAPFQGQADEDNPDGEGANYALQRCPNGTGSRRETSAYISYPPTPGAANTCVEPTGACCAGTVCTVETRNNCINGVFGRYQGDGTNCDGEPNNSVCDCRMIQAAKDAAAGTGFRLCNVVVTNVISTVASPNKAVQVQDFSGPSGAPRGITIFGTETLVNAALAGAVPGQRISLTGTTIDFNGLRELGDDPDGHPQPLLSLGAPVNDVLPAPVVVTIADLQDGSVLAEQLESVRIKLECVQFNQTGTFAGTTNYTVSDGGAFTATVRIPTAAINLVGDPIPVGNVGLIGVLTQFDNSAPFDAGYQLLLVDENDIVAATNCPPANTGACCLPIGTCVELTEVACGANNGVYQGDLTTCPDPDCVATVGACCAGGTCTETTLDACNTAGGTFSGLGTPCSAVTCCGTITEARTASNDGQSQMLFELCEVVVIDTTDLINSATTKSFVAQDASCPNGAIGVRGIGFAGPNADIDNILNLGVVPGTRLRIRGNAEHFNGLFQLGEPYSNVTILGATAPPAPVVITAADVADQSLTAECYESRLVTINCLTFQDAGNFTALTNYTALDQGGNPVTVRIQTTALNLVGQPIPTGPTNVTGILGQFDNAAPFDSGYQLMPRSTADLTPCVPCACVADMDLSGTRNGFDIRGFVECLLGAGSNCACADADGMNGVNTDDIDDFAMRIINFPTCP